MIGEIKTLDDVNVKNKRVLVRLDLNSDIINRKLIPSDRLIAPLQTLMELRKRGAITVILAHQGRPKSKDFTSLKPHYLFLKKYIPNLKFVNDIIGTRAQHSISSLKQGDVLLLDNVRFIKDELNYSKDKIKENKLLKILAPLFSLYINDAFSASHREHASIVAFPKLMESCIGRVFQQELQAIQKLHMSNALYVLGGAKPEDNVKLLKNNRVLASGLFGPFCLMSLGVKLGKQNKIMQDDLKTYSGTIKSNHNNLILPTDLAIEHNKKRLDLSIEEFPVDNEILDLGINTIEAYVREILNARAVFFKGLVGLCNKPDFEIGTKALLLALAQNKGFTVVSGGHTLTMLEKFNIPKSSFSYVSLSGGALIHYLANHTLLGIEAMIK